MASPDKSRVGNDDKKENIQTVADDDVELCQSGDSVEFNFSTKTWREDMALIVENKKIYVASNILSLMSPVFTTMFDDHFKEEGPREIQLPGKKFNDVAEFLRCIYPNIEKEVSAENVTKVLSLADEYKVMRLKKVCEDFLVAEITEMTSAEEICVCLQHGTRYNLDELKAKCYKRVSAIDIDAFNAAETKHPLPPEAKSEINDIWIKQISCLKTECQTLTGFVKDSWTANESYSSFEASEIGTLKFSVEGVSELINFESYEIAVHGIRWSAKVTKGNLGYGENISVQLQANAPEHWYDWSCEVLWKVIILNNKNRKLCGKLVLRKHTFTLENKSNGYPNLSLWNRNDVDDEITVMVCLLVKEPVSKPFKTN